MSVVQSTYPNTHEKLVVGQMVNPNDVAVDSLILDDSSADVPFGSPVMFTSEGCTFGAARPIAALASAASTTSDTSLDYDNPAHGALQAGRHIVAEGNAEVIFLSAVASATAATMVRGALGTTAAAIANNDELYYLDEILFAGIALMDERLDGQRDEEFEGGDPVPVIWRGDVAVQVSAAVSKGDLAVVTLVAATGDAVGSLSGRSPDGYHVQIPGAEFVSAAADDGIAVLRLSGYRSAA